MKRLDHRELVVIVRTRLSVQATDWANNVNAAQKRLVISRNTDSLSDQTMLAEDFQRTVQRQCFYGTALAANRRGLEE